MKPHARRRLQVLKFGGTSVGDAERIEQACARIAGSAREGRTIAVVSAMAGTTNLLLSSARSAAGGGEAGWREACEEIRERHLKVAGTLLGAKDHARFVTQLKRVLGEFEKTCRRFAAAGKTTARGMDRVGGLGEVLSAELVAGALRAVGKQAEAIDASELIITDDRHGDATVLAEPTKARLRKRLLPLVERGVVPVVTGFRGATRAGVPTTLGRGSSDYTATLIGALLGASEVTIWTDVDGVMTADPRLVPGARVIARLSYGEAIELAFFGGKVIHWKAILPVMESCIPLRVRNSFRPATGGTSIEAGTASHAAVAAVSALARVRLLTVRGDRSVGPVELATRVLGWLDTNQTHPLLLLHSSTENAVALALGHEEAAAVGRLEQQLSGEKAQRGLALQANEEVGLVAAIGAEMRHAPAVAARIYGALARRRIDIFATANGPSGKGVAMAVRPGEVGPAVRAIHGEFRLQGERRSTKS
jgi:aspartokinase/homoserine dehydrogenase 1